MAGTGWVIYALYGAPPTGSNIGYNDVTALVSAQYAGGQTSFNATNANYGPDPDAGTVKSLVIVYAYTSATSLAPGIYPINSFQTVTATCAENASITLPPANVPQTSDFSPEVEAVIDIVQNLLKTDPQLPGIVSAQIVAANAFGGRGEEDARLLAGRLYFDAVGKVTSSATDPSNTGMGSAAAARFSPERIRRALGAPLPVDQFGQQYFAILLNETRDRMNRDPVFARKINGFSAGATRFLNCKCEVDKIEVPCWICIISILFGVVNPLNPLLDL